MPDFKKFPEGPCSQTPPPSLLFTPQWPYQSKIAGSGPDHAAVGGLLACKKEPNNAVSTRCSSKDRRFIELKVVITAYCMRARDLVHVVAPHVRAAEFRLRGIKVR